MDFMHTPNMDRLAGEGVLFKNHYVQVPTCGASRCSLLTGLRPRSNAHLSNSAFNTLPREKGASPTSMPELFRDNGYTTVSMGKVTHTPSGRRWPKPSGMYTPDGKMVFSGPADREPELALAWDYVDGPADAWEDPWSAFFGYAGGKTRTYQDPKMPAWEAADVPDTGYPDGLIAEEAIQQLRKVKNKPFFLAAGFFKPHLPFCAPKKYFDLYDPEAIPLPPHPAAPQHVDLTLSSHKNGELTGNYAALTDPLHATEAETRQLRHAYCACVSYADAQVGKLLDELDTLGLRDNTIVVLWGDHGWHLGDLHIWGKHTAFEYALRSTLVMRVPGAKANGSATSGIVESLDLYPTLADYCRLKTPKPLDGTSLRPMLEEAEHPGKDAAFGYWKSGKAVARTMRTAKWRVTEWKNPDDTTVQTELYDHESDPGETVNVAATQEEVLKQLLPRLQANSAEMLSG